MRAFVLAFTSRLSASVPRSVRIGLGAAESGATSRIRRPFSAAFHLLALGVAAAVSFLELVLPARAEPDLTVLSLSAPTNLLTGSSVTCTALVTNSGNAPSRFCRLDIYLSTDEAIGPEDQWLAVGFLEALDATAVIAITPAFSLESSIRPGPYYLLAMVDSENAVRETDEFNNTRSAGPLRVSPGVDVAAVSLRGPTNIFAGITAYSFTNVVASLGPYASGPFSTRFYLSTDAIITSNDTYLADLALPSLAASASYTSSIPVIFGFIPPGDYYLGAIADYDNQLFESNELNNALAPLPIHVSLDLDLDIPGISGPAIASVGGTLTLTTRVHNASVHTAAPVFNLGIYRSADSVLDTTDTYQAQFAFPQLSAGETRAATQTITIGNLPPGTYYYGAIADPDQRTPEINETNNSSPGVPVVVRVGLDLAMQSVTGPTSLKAGDAFNVTAVILNQGADDAGAVDVGLYLSPDPVITTGDRRIGTLHFNSVPANGAGTNTAPCTVTATLAGGTYYLGAVADYLNQIPETKEFNNAFAGHTVAVESPCDLVTTNLPIAPIASAGGGLEITNIVRNLGSNTTPTHFFTRCFLSTDPIITTNDTFLIQAEPTGLGPGSSRTNILTVMLPKVPAGDYYVGAIVDSENRIPEPDELNNVSSAQLLHVRHGIDFASTYLSASPVWTNNAYMPLTNIIANLGVDWPAHFFYYGYYASQDATITTNDFLLSGIQVSYWNYYAFGPGQFVTNDAVYVPPNLPPGTYYIGVMVDYTGEIPEPNETNNVMLGPRVEVRAASDLALVAFGAPSAVVGGRTITLTNVVQYAGSGLFLSPRIGFYLSTDAVITTNDTLLGSGTLTFLNAGDVRSNVFSFNFPGTVAPGAYYLGAVVDGRNDVVEPDEANNTLPGWPIQVSVQVDLAPTALTADTNASLGGIFRQSVGVTNGGTVSVVTPFEVGFFLSADADITTNDLFVGSLTLNSVFAGQQTSMDRALILSNSVPPGLYYFGAVIDWRNVIAETDESNNAILGPRVQVRVGLDMAPLAVSAQGVAVVGGDINFTNTYANVGLDPGYLITVGYYLSADSAITTNDWLLGQWEFTLILVGIDVTRTESFKVPRLTPPGVYRAGVIVDPNNALLEIDKSNNSLAGSLVEVLDPNSISLTQIRVAGTNVLVSFTTVPGRNYAVERAPLLPANGSWSPVLGAGFVPGTGGELDVSDPDGLGPNQRFYRVRLLP